MPDYIAFVDDTTEELEQYEYSVTGRSEEEAYINAQEAFPFGIVTAIVRSDELDALDQLKRRAEKRRLQEQNRLRRIWPDELMKALGAVGRFPD
jgi:hypothetical protein